MDSEETTQEPFDVGIEIDNVSLDIDYQIIQHFSQHLYGSPNKAVEELIANSFDAFAKKVYVYLKGKFTSDYLLVWDDGNSMDVEGLKHLWLIADSPKDGEERVIHQTGLPDRAVIGKFGIGKLASYSIGDEIVHICRKNSDFLLVHVNYGDFLDRNDRSKSVSSGESHKAPIRKISEEEAKQIIESLFNENLFENLKTKPLAFDDFFNKEHWTLAIIGKLKKNLTQGRLLWLLGNGMPLRPDFEILVDDAKVVSKLESNYKTLWDFGTIEVQKQIQKDWDDAVARGEVNGEISFGKEKGLDPNFPNEETPFVKFPNLDLVRGKFKLFENTLVDERAEKIGRSYGFFIMVRERLVNPDDAKYTLRDPYFGAFYRSQYFLYFNQDEDLLADRERFKKDTLVYDEMSLLLSSVYKVTRRKIEADDEQEVESQKTENLLPIKSSELFRSPLSSYLSKNNLDEGVSFNLKNPEIVHKANGESKPIAIISIDGKGFDINTSHPYYTVLEEKLGKGKKSQPFYQALDLISVSEVLLQGYLYDIGISDKKVEQIAIWRDNLFRQLAENYRKSKSDLADKLMNASYLGDAEFEVALRDILEDMGFLCERDGDKGKKDILLTATIGIDSYKYIFEAKGSITSVSNKTAHTGGAAAHRDEVNKAEIKKEIKDVANRRDLIKATHAVIVAREFGGLVRNPDKKDAAILNECESIGGVSIMTVEAIIQLHEAINEYIYPLDLLKDVFIKLETPTEKLKSITSLQNPLENFEFKSLLEDIAKWQSGKAQGDSVPIKTIKQDNDKWREQFPPSEEAKFTAKLFALATLAGGLIILSSDNREVILLQSPENIAQLIEKNLHKLIES